MLRALEQLEPFDAGKDQGQHQQSQQQDTSGPIKSRKERGKEMNALARQIKGQAIYDLMRKLKVDEIPHVINMLLGKKHEWHTSFSTWAGWMHKDAPTAQKTCAWQHLSDTAAPMQHLTVWQSPICSHYQVVVEQARILAICNLK